MASAMETVFGGLSRLLKNPPYSFTFHSSFTQEKYHRAEQHRHVKIRQGIGLREGFSWATGLFVNQLPLNWRRFTFARRIERDTIPLPLSRKDGEI